MTGVCLWVHDRCAWIRLFWTFDATLEQYFRYNKQFTYHFRLEKSNTLQRDPHKRISGRLRQRTHGCLPPPLRPFSLFPAHAVLVVSVESTSIKPLSRLASALVIRSQRLDKTTVRLQAAWKRLKSGWLKPRTPGFNQPTLYTSDPVLFHARAHYCLCLHPVAKCGHA